MVWCSTPRGSRLPWKASVNRNISIPLRCDESKHTFGIARPGRPPASIARSRMACWGRIPSSQETAWPADVEPAYPAFPSPGGGPWPRRRGGVRYGGNLPRPRQAHPNFGPSPWNHGIGKGGAAEDSRGITGTNMKKPPSSGGLCQLLNRISRFAGYRTWE